MAKIIYPFAAIPNQIIRGGHGAINLAVLAVLLSHGKTTASIATMADEIGCDKKSIIPAIRYWEKEGPKLGLFIRKRERDGKTSIYEIEITSPENGRGADSTPPENGSAPHPKTGQVPHPKTGHEEEQCKKNNKEEPVPKGTGAKPGSFGNIEINEILAFFTKAIGGTLDGSDKENRRYSWSVLQRIKKDYPGYNAVATIKHIIQKGLTDPFHGKNLTGAKYLFYNLQKIIQSAIMDDKKAKNSKITRIQT